MWSKMSQQRHAGDIVSPCDLSGLFLSVCEELHYGLQGVSNQLLGFLVSCTNKRRDCVSIWSIIWIASWVPTEFTYLGCDGFASSNQVSFQSAHWVGGERPKAPWIIYVESRLLSCCSPAPGAWRMSFLFFEQKPRARGVIRFRLKGQNADAVRMRSTKKRECVYSLFYEHHLTHT